LDKGSFNSAMKISYSKNCAKKHNFTLSYFHTRMLSRITKGLTVILLLNLLVFISLKIS